MHAFLFSILVFSLASAAAQTSPLGTFDREVTKFLPDDARLVAGGGVGMISQPYTGTDAVRLVPEPLVVFQTEKFSFIGRTLGYEVYQEGPLSVSAIAEWRFFGHDGGDDSPFLEGMRERKGTAEIGVRADLDLGRTDVSGTFRADALSRHGGYEIEGRISHELSTWPPLSVRPNGGLRFQSQDLTGYYFGVREDEAVVAGEPLSTGNGPALGLDRPAYSPDAAITPFIGLTARQSVTPKIAAVGGFDLNFFDPTVTDSPIVEERYQVFAFLGVIYVFGDARATVGH
ncbi:MAG: MipA/OmpV family protein [Parvularcula sp.]|jgi:outer membrane scaffolding protein for murein synthesis (MipA/OmpV family)|nr:MipA/OmpV family protein [Parvularcula sp.]